jgi:hypothetical protein
MAICIEWGLMVPAFALKLMAIHIGVPYDGWPPICIGWGLIVPAFALKLMDVWVLMVPAFALKVMAVRIWCFKMDGHLYWGCN